MADAIAKLEANHDRIEALFSQLKQADEAETRRLGIEVCQFCADPHGTRRRAALSGASRKP